MLERVGAIVRERERLEHALHEIDGVTPTPSGANFILFRVRGDAERLWELLVARGVLVRNFARWPGVEGCLRVTVGTPDENDLFLTALRAAISEVTS
jgi:histidinol-phosphate aminotransferase